MATQQEIASLEARLAQIAARISTLQADASRIKNEVDRSIAREDFSLARSQSNTLDQINAELSGLITTQQQLEQELRALRSQPAPTPAPSAGAQVQGAQTAKDDGANTQEPEKQPPQVLNPNGRITNAPVVRPTNTTPPSTQTNDQNTNPQPPKPLSTTQAPNANQRPGPVPSSPAAERNNVVVPAAKGQGSRSDDNIDNVNGSTNNATVQEVNSVFGNQYIEPQPNELKKYGSYTYNLAWYLLSPDDYKSLVDTGKADPYDVQLLMQSGGIPDTGSVTVSIGGQSATAGSRNPNFYQDYYIDDLEMRSLFAGKGTNAGHNVTDFTFTVREPNGLTLLDNLYNAIVEFNRTGGNANNNYAAQQYLMVIKFWGYDENGIPQIASGSAAGGAVGAAANVQIKKYIPFIIKNITFNLQDAAVTYRVECAAVPYEIAAASVRGSIPFSVELSGDDVKTILGGGGNITVGTGTAVGSDGRETVAAPPRNPGTGASGFPINSTIAANQGPAKANSAPKKTLKRGLMEALNGFQQELVKRGVYNVADVYKIEFANPSLADAKIRKKGQLNKNAVPFTANGTTAQGKLPDKVTPDVENRIFNITQGTQIVQVIDQVVRMSQFIDDQAKFVVDEETGQLKENTGTQTPSWYKISFKTKPLAYDKKRNDYAYEITFVISLYGLQNLQSVYFQSPTFRGVHKRYAYWFTGENTEVLKFEQAYNKLWVQVLEGNKILDTQTSSAANMREMPKRAFFTASAQSSQGAARGANEPGANAADYLYSPADQGSVRMSIVGDPAWIQQGEFVKGSSARAYDFNPFLPDGTINVDAQQVLFEIVFKRPGDYNINTGLLKPVGSEQSFVYFCKSVVSRFSGGAFTQELEGALVIENIPALQRAPQTETQRTPARTTTNNSARQPALSSDNSQNLDALSFGQAFKQARSDYGGAGGVFDWRGKQYQTNLKGEAYVANPVPVYGAQTQAEALRLRNADNSTASSAGAVVGQSGSETGTTQDGAVVTGQTNPVGQTSQGGVQVVLSTGEEVTMFTPQQAQLAVAAGLLTQTQANTVKVQLQAKQQAPRPITRPYQTVGDDA
jgi:hypothetical protein